MSLQTSLVDETKKSFQHRTLKSLLGKGLLLGEVFLQTIEIKMHLVGLLMFLFLKLINVTYVDSF